MFSLKFHIFESLFEALNCSCGPFCIAPNIVMISVEMPGEGSRIAGILIVYPDPRTELCLPVL